MIRVFKNRFPEAKISSGGGSDLKIEMDFSEISLGDDKK